MHDTRRGAEVPPHRQAVVDRPLAEDLREVNVRLRHDVRTRLAPVGPVIPVESIGLMSRISPCRTNVQLSPVRAGPDYPMKSFSVALVVDHTR